jgi:hypothetical protein
MKVYKRIRDLPEPLFDSLEQLCNIEAKEGWEILCIDTSCFPKTATLFKEVKNVRSTKTK